MKNSYGIQQKRLVLFRQMIYADKAAFCSIMKYDALDIENSGVYVIYNRSKCVASNRVVSYD